VTFAAFVPGYSGGTTTDLHRFPDSNVGNNAMACLAQLSTGFSDCFLLAVRYEIATIAFPAISTGAYRFPRERAAKIAVRETRQFLESQLAMRKVVFVCFNGATLDGYRKVLAERPQGKA